MELGVEETESYWGAITVIEAQEMLKQLTVSMAPNMKASQYKTLHRELHRKAYPKTYDGPAVGPKELARLLGAGRIR